MKYVVMNVGIRRETVKVCLTDKRLHIQSVKINKKYLKYNSLFSM
jgi:hypothetical protein